jgi:hypothetical protein
MPAMPCPFNGNNLHHWHRISYSSRLQQAMETVTIVCSVMSIYKK